MLIYSLAPPLKQKDDRAPGSWFRARQAAVNLYSLEEFGLKEGSTTAEPRLLFRGGGSRGRRRGRGSPSRWRDAP
eukprot:scaffold48926_cov36-Phaeocystis_antarctica.AAC.1